MNGVWLKEFKQIKNPAMNEMVKKKTKTKQWRRQIIVEKLNLSCINGVITQWHKLFLNHFRLLNALYFSPVILAERQLCLHIASPLPVSPSVSAVMRRNQHVFLSSSLQLHVVHYNSELYPNISAAKTQRDGLAVLGILIVVIKRYWWTVAMLNNLKNNRLLWNKSTCFILELLSNIINI